MTSERHERIGEIYHRLLEVAKELRPAMLDEACRDDVALRRDVESLLAADEQAGSFMDAPALVNGIPIPRRLSGDPPAQIGRYPILSLLGRGGMGEVYLAEDPLLRRKVAIKLLAAAFTADAHAVARFIQEAQAASSLNHPNIVTIYEIGEFEGGRFIAMEFVDGQPLGTLAGRPMPAGQVVPIAQQLAQALAAAHTAGIVHRDLKPDNVIRRTDGYVKLLDFGVARLLSAPAASQGASPLPTRAGAVIGTPRYMSPEQIRGEPATTASDIYSLGVVLHELLTGRHATETAVTGAAGTAHRALSDLIARMLDRNPARRPQAADIDAALQHSRVSAPPWFRARRRHWLTAAGAAAGLVAAVVFALRGEPSQPNPLPDAAPVRFQIVPPPNTAFSPSSASFALSPDGKVLAFTASQIDQQAMGLWIQPLDSVSARSIPSVRTAGQLFWLPDSASLAFADTSADFGLRIVDVGRAVVQRIENVLLGPAGVGSAGRQTTLVRLDGSAVLHQLAPDGGAPEPVTRLDAARGETNHSFPAFLPDERHFLFLASSTLPEHDGMAYIGQIGSPRRLPLFKSDSQVVYADPGFLLYMLGDTLLARAFDASSLRVTGPGRPVADQVERNSSSRRGAFTVSQTGVLAYRQLGETELTWYDRTGRRLRTLGPPGHYRNPAQSPDGRTIAVGRLDPRHGTWDVWTIDVERQALARVTTDPSSEDMPVWSPDGAELAFKSDRRQVESLLQVYRQRLAQDAAPVLLYSLTAPNLTLHMWSREGLLYSALDVDLSLQRIPGTAIPLVTTAFSWEPFAQISPDGNWMAYGSNETGSFEIYITRPEPGRGKTLVSAGGGTEPVWRKDGRELFYLSAERQLMALPVAPGPTLTAGTPTALFQTTLSALINSSYTRNQYVVSADGQQFLINQPTGRGALAAVTVLVNWPSTLSGN